MDEYISREDYCEENCGKENREGYKTCKNRGMLNIPTADVQSVVRCKDCKYRKERHYEEIGEKPYIKYECKFTKYSMSDDGFCSFGATMNDDTEGKVTERNIEVSRPDGNCLDCKFQYRENSDHWCSICPGNPEDI